MRAITFPDGSRFYECDGKLLPSVTTVLAATRTKKEREKLEKWEAEVGIEQAQRIRQESLARGTALHRMIESYFDGDEVDCPEHLSGFWEQTRKVLPHIPEYLSSELTVTHPKEGYAGTLDLLGFWLSHENLTLFDFKTSSKPKRRNWLDEHQLQVSAYIKALESAEFEGINQGMIVVLTPYNFQLFSLEREDIEQCYKSWLRRKEKYDKTHFPPSSFEELTACAHLPQKELQSKVTV